MIETGRINHHIICAFALVWSWGCAPAPNEQVASVTAAAAAATGSSGVGGAGEPTGGTGGIGANGGSGGTGGIGANGGSGGTGGIGANGGSGGTGGGGGASNDLGDCHSPGAPFHEIWKIPMSDAYDIDTDAAGNTYVARDGKCLSKYSPQGTQLDSLCDSSWGSGHYTKVVVGPDGRFLLDRSTCIVHSSPFPTCYSDRGLYKETTSPFNQLWPSSSAIAFRANGDVIGFDFASINILNDSQSIVWSASIPQSKNSARTASGDSTGAVIVGGRCEGLPNDPPCISRIDAQGSLTYTVNYPIVTDDVHSFHTLAIGPLDSIYSLGSHQGGSGYWITRIASDGTPQWTVHFSYDTPNPFLSRPLDLAVLPNGDVWMTGFLGSAGNFLRGYSSNGDFLAEAILTTCDDKPFWIKRMRSDHKGGLRILTADTLYAITP